MNSSASRRAKRDVIVLDDADEPPVKREAEEPVPSAEVAELNQKLKQSDEKFQKLCALSRRDKEALQARVDYLERIIDSKEHVVKKPSDEDELKKKMNGLERDLKEANKQAMDYKQQAEILKDLMDSKVQMYESLRDIEQAKQLEEERRARVEDREKIAQLTNQLEEERIVREDTANELRNMNIELTNQLEEERRARMKDREKFEQQQQPTVVMEPLPNEADLTHNEAQLPIVDDFLEESLFDVDMNFMEDSIINGRDSTPIEEQSLTIRSSSGENEEESAQTEMFGKANDSMEEEEEKERTVHNTTDIPKNSSETGKVEKKMRPRRTSSRPVNYTEFIDESEPPVKKPNIKPNCDKKFYNKRKSDRDESSSKQSTRAVRVTKLNHTELECPNCEYRSRTVQGWYLHLYNTHSTTPLELGLALVCECGNESFTDTHSRSCDTSKISIIRKNATPKCVMCEIHPKTVGGYAHHLHHHHKATLIQMGIFLLCSCGYKLRSNNHDSEHTKKCNGHEFTLHKLEDE